MTTLSVRLFGQFQLSADGKQPTPIANLHLQLLLAYLLIYRQRTHTRQQLAHLLWPETSEHQAQSNLRTLLAALRKELPAIQDLLQVDRKTVQWQNDCSFTLDVEEFAQLVHQAEQLEKLGDPEQAIERFRQVVELYADKLLPAFQEDWILAVRQTLHTQFVTSVGRLVRLLCQQDAYPAAIGYVRRLIHQDPLNEAAHYQLMELYSFQGDRANVLRAYQAYQETLQKALGLEPSATFQALSTSLINVTPFQVVPVKPHRANRVPAPSTEAERELDQLIAASRRIPTHAQAGTTHFLVCLARLLAQRGQTDQAWITLTQAFASLTTPEDRFWEAELHRIMGNLLWQQGKQVDDIEMCFLEAIELARRHNAKFLELCATASLCLLWQQHGRYTEARQQLKLIYQWFAPGVDALDLNTLHETLEQLL